MPWAPVPPMMKILEVMWEDIGGDFLSGGAIAVR
jgi:hypothetical protein